MNEVITCPSCEHPAIEHSRAGCLHGGGAITAFCPCDMTSAQVEREVTSLLPAPVLPYAGTSGHSGSDTSRKRAETRDANGQTRHTQRQVLAYVQARRRDGATIADVRAAFPNEHHGTLSGALSVLHHAGHLARLTEHRDRCAVYVAPEYVHDRGTVAQGRRRPTLTQAEREALARVQTVLDTSGAADTLTSLFWREEVRTVVAALRRLA